MKFSASSSKKPSSLGTLRRAGATGPAREWRLVTYGESLGFVEDHPEESWGPFLLSHWETCIDGVYQWEFPSAHVARRAISRNSATPTVPSGYVNNSEEAHH